MSVGTKGASPSEISVDHGTTPARDGQSHHGCTMHATAIAADKAGILILGRSGLGKSGLALRAMARAPNAFIDETVRLVADDQVQLERHGGNIVAGPPANLAGKLEVRGIGIIEVGEFCPYAVIKLVVQLVSRADVERLPDPMPTTRLLGLDFPLLNLDPEDPGAVEKLLLAVRRAVGKDVDPDI